MAKQSSLLLISELSGPGKRCKLTRSSTSSTCQPPLASDFRKPPLATSGLEPDEEESRRRLVVVIGCHIEVRCHIEYSVEGSLIQRHAQDHVLYAAPAQVLQELLIREVIPQNLSRLLQGPPQEFPGS